MDRYKTSEEFTDGSREVFEDKTSISNVLGGSSFTEEVRPSSQKEDNSCNGSRECPIIVLSDSSCSESENFDKQANWYNKSEQQASGKLFS